MDSAHSEPATPPSGDPIDWESFYRSYRKPGYVPGFEIVNKLGGGVFGMVFKARKESIGKDYAIKFLKVDDEVVRDAVGRELDAVRFFAQIDHPNLVSIEDKGMVDGIPYIVMSYAGQDTLRSRMQAGRLEREEALRIFVQAARGVAALHSHSLVHFDLKPANIFLKGDIARVGDYGLSKLVTESRNSLSFGRGTPYYMAPEMMQRRGDVRSDVYSLGVLLFECLTGEVPFRGDSEWEVLRKHERELPEFPPELPAVERAVIARCLQKDPDARYQSVDDLLRDLQAPVALGESMVIPPLVRSEEGTSDSDAARPVPPPPEPPPEPQAVAGGDPLVRDPRHSPYGLPWREPVALSGPLTLSVRGVFKLFEAVVFVVLLPLRLVSLTAGRGLLWLLAAPFRLLGFSIKMAGYTFVLLVIVLALVGILSMT